MVLFRSPFIYMTLLGISEIPAYTVPGFIIHRFGRKPTVIGGLLMSGILQNILIMMIVFGFDHKNLAGMILSSVAYTFVCAIYQVSF